MPPRLYIPDYATQCVYRDLSLEELQEVGERVKHRFGVSMHCHDIKAVEPQAFPQKFALPWEQFEDLFQQHRDRLRRYTLHFYQGKLDTKGAPISRVEFALAVIMRSKFGDRDKEERQICLRGLGCYPFDYAQFVKIVLETLGLQKAPPAGMDWEDVGICDRAGSAIKNAGLVDAISGALGRRRYEEAMQNAVILVESKLREKCLWAGKNDAQNATGHELAVIAYHQDTGCLRPPWAVAANADQGAMQLFMGFNQYLRNAFGHNAVVMGGDKSSVFELLAFCEFLLRVIEKSTKR